MNKGRNRSSTNLENKGKGATDEKKVKAPEKKDVPTK